MPAGLSQAAADGGAAHKVATVINGFQAARTQFVSAIQDFLGKKDGGATMDALVNHNILGILTCPLVKDPIMGIQISALTTLGELARLNAEASHEICVCGILDEMVQSLSHENRHIRSASNTSLQSVAKHDRDCAQSIVDAGVVEAVRRQLETLDAMVKETAVKTIDVLVEKGPDFADSVTDVPTLSTCVSHLRMPEDAAPQSMKTHIALMLSDVANHNEDLARRVVECEALPAVASLLGARSTKPPLRAACLKMMSQVAKHSTELAEMVVQQGIMPRVLHSLTDEDHAPTRLSAAALVQEVARRTPELAEVVSSDGGCTSLVRNLELSGAGTASLAALMSIGHIAGMSAKIAKQLVESDVPHQLIVALECPDPEIKGAAGWAIEQIANHGTITAKPLAENGVLIALGPAYKMLPDGEIKNKIKMGMKAVIKECKSNMQLEPLVRADTAPDILRHILNQFAEMLPGDIEKRRSFVTSGALMHMQMLEVLSGMEVRSLACIKEINDLFPADVIEYYRPK